MQLFSIYIIERGHFTLENRLELSTKWILSLIKNTLVLV